MKRLLLILMCFALFFSLSLPAFAVEKADEYRTLTIKPFPGWTEVYLYTTENRDLGTWPGKALQKYSNVYVITLKCSMKNLTIHGKDANGAYVQSTITLLDDREELAQHGKGMNATITIDRHISRGKYRATVDYDSLGSDQLAEFFYDLGTSTNYRVVGNADWFGSGDPGNNQCSMNEISPGVFRRTIYHVIPGEYKLKVTKDGTWEGAYGDAKGDYYTLSMTTPGTVTVELKHHENGAVLSVYTQSGLSSVLSAFPTSSVPSGKLFPLFLFTFSIMAVCLYLWFLLQRREKFAGDVTPEGKVHRRTAPLSRKAVIQTVRENGPAPPPELDQAVFDAIQKVKKSQEAP